MLTSFSDRRGIASLYLLPLYYSSPFPFLLLLLGCWHHYRHRGFEFQSLIISSLSSLKSQDWKANKTNTFIYIINQSSMLETTRANLQVPARQPVRKEGRKNYCRDMNPWLFVAGVNMSPLSNAMYRGGRLQAFRGIKSNYKFIDFIININAANLWNLNPLLTLSFSSCALFCCMHSSSQKSTPLFILVYTFYAFMPGKKVKRRKYCKENSFAEAEVHYKIKPPKHSYE